MVSGESVPDYYRFKPQLFCDLHHQGSPDESFRFFCGQNFWPKLILVWIVHIFGFIGLSRKSRAVNRIAFKNRTNKPKRVLHEKCYTTLLYNPLTRWRSEVQVLYGAPLLTSSNRILTCENHPSSRSRGSNHPFRTSK